jgi:AraC-like DNA-binding protein
MDRELDAATASTQIARAILMAAATYGHDAAALAARFGLSPEELADPDGRIPAPVGIAMWDEVPRIVGDERFGLHLGTRASDAGALPIVGYVVQTSPTLGEGISRALRYQRLVQTLNRAELAVEGATARLTVHVRPHHTEPLRHAVDFALAYCVALAGRITGAPLPVRRALFGHSAPARRDDYVAIFGEDLTFGAPRTQLELDAAVLDRPVLSADAQLRTLVERHAEALLARLPAGDSLVERARAALVDGLRGDRTGIDDVARALRMSARTLQRRLHDAHTTHALLLDEVRRELALRYVADASLSLSEVAFLLGFSDQTTFHRAFVRWTGHAPGAHRKELHAGGQRAAGLTGSPGPLPPGGSRGSPSPSRRP